MYFYFYVPKCLTQTKHELSIDKKNVWFYQFGIENIAPN